MQTIQHVIQQHNLSTHSGIAAKVVPQTTTSSRSTDSEKAKKRIDRLFLRLAAMYGHMWRSLYKSEEFLHFTKQEWLESLMPFDDQIIAKTLNYARNHWEYPPTLPQFLECCQANKKISWIVQPLTSQTKSTLEVAHMHLNKIKAFLNIKGE